MNKKARDLLKKLSEIRSKLLGLADDATEETRAALTTELVDTETAFRAALDEAPEIPEGRGAGEGAEFRALEQRVNAFDYFDAARNFPHSRIEGAAAEYNAALHLPAGEMPMRLLAPPEERTVTDVDIAVRPTGWLDRLFAETAAVHLGFEMIEAEPGSKSFPVTTTGADPAQRGPEQVTAAGAWTVGVKTIDPTRMTLRYKFAVEDAARVPGLEQALIRDLRMAITERVDYTIFNGDTGANPNTGDIAGIFGLTGVTEVTLTQANKVKAVNTLSAFVDMLDGLHAVMPSDLRVVASVGADRLWRKTIANSAAENQTVSQFLEASGIMHRSREGIDTATADGDYGAAVGLQRGVMGALQCVMWPTMSIIRDPYSEAGAGAVNLIIHALWNYAIVRKSNLQVLKFVA